MPIADDVWLSHGVANEPWYYQAPRDDDPSVTATYLRSLPEEQMRMMWFMVEHDLDAIIKKLLSLEATARDLNRCGIEGATQIGYVMMSRIDTAVDLLVTAKAGGKMMEEWQRAQSRLESEAALATLDLTDDTSQTSP